MKKFSEILKNLRTSNNMTQQDLANLLGVSRATIAGYETKGKQPDYEKLISLSKLFKVPVDYLIGNTVNPTTLKSNSNKVDKKLDDFIEEVEKTDGLMFSGGPMDEQTKQVLLKMLRTTKDMAEEINKSNSKK